MRLGWFPPVRCKSMEAQETRAMLTARKLVQKELLETESSLRYLRRLRHRRKQRDRAGYVTLSCPAQIQRNDSSVTATGQAKERARTLRAYPTLGVCRSMMHATRAQTMLRTG
jgi:hypothetical protein